MPARWRCFHLDGCHQIGKLLMCAPDMLHPFELGSGLTVTYHDLPTAVYKVVRGWNARTNISKLWDPHPQCHWEEMVSILVWIARAFKPIARGLAHWRRSRCIDGFLGHQMTNESESVKCSPSPISQPIHLTLQTPSRSNGLIGEEKRLLQAPIVPKCRPMKSQIKGRCHRSSLKRRD